MPQETADNLYVCTIIQQLGSKTMPSTVPGYMLINTSLLCPMTQGFQAHGV